MSFLARHNAFIAGAAGSGKSFLIKQISECTTKRIYVTNMTGRAAKVLKNKTKTIHSFASGLLFTSYFRSPQLAETCDEKSEKFHPLSLYYFR